MITGKVQIGPAAFKNAEGNFDPSTLYETVWHEGQHTIMRGASSAKWKYMPDAIWEMHKKAQHSVIYSIEKERQYYMFWSSDVTSYVNRQAAKITKYELYEYIFGYSKLW